ncbi:MAG: thioesterase [Desulfurococcales archaeon]|nr:thioesterase [Desulfurococcales archaeon]
MSWECTYTYKVEREHAAQHLAERGEYVLSTPCLVLFMEASARKCLDNNAGVTSVGYRVDVKHRKSVRIGEEITVMVKVFEWDSRRALVYMKAYDSSGDLVGEGINERFKKG